MDQLILNLSYGLGLHHTIGWFLPIFLGTVNILPSLITIFYYADKSAEFNRMMEDKEDPLYDFIVVGGGTSGSVVANRLSKKYRVLLIERGGEPHPLTSVPGLESALINMPGLDYAYLTTPQNDSCLSLNNKQSLWSAGSSLGGTSTINSMVYLRGHPYDFDIWGHWTSDKRWNYESVLPYFLRSENYCFRCESVKGRTPVYPPFHGSDGELHLQKPAGKTNLLKEFISAFEWAGIPMADLNAPFVRGVDGVTYAQRSGRRMSCKDAFLDPVKANLKIAKYSRVYKVLFDGKQAFGVEYEQFGKILRARVKLEVILSAGSIESPKILLLSGIGPAQHLKEIGIPLLVDAPGVGENLQDHVGTMLGPFLISQPLSYLPVRDINVDSGDEFLTNGTGPLSLSFAHGVAIFPSSKAEFAVYPDIQVGLSSLGISSSTAATLSKIYNLNLTTVTQFYAPLLQQRESVDSFNLIVNYARPRSRGSLKLQSNDFKLDPIIDPNYFGVTEDLDILVEGLRIALEIGENAPSFRNLKVQLSPFPWPKCLHEKFRSDAYLHCLAKEMTLTLHHYVGTVRMGGDGPLDSELRVKGVEGLRVVDASVMPFITSMNTMGPCIMIGERGAGFILERWGNIGGIGGGEKEVLPQVPQGALEHEVGVLDQQNFVNYEHSFRKMGT